MRRAAQRGLCLLCCLALLWPGAAQASFVVVDETSAPLPTQAPALPTPAPAERPLPFEALPALDDAGFLPAPLFADGPAFVHVDEKAGHWIYISETLNVRIERRRLKQRYKWVYYFIAHVRFRGDEHFRAFSKNPQRPARDMDKPEIIAREHRVVYAQNGDLFTWRLQKKKYAGVIIRDGQVLSTQTYDRTTVNTPPLDELSLYADGRVLISPPGVISPEEYLERGALDVLAFGPTLLKDGVKDPRLETDFRHLEPRSAIGVVAPGHFVGIMVEGRNKRSTGAGLHFVADRLLEEGCVDAFTLDGGQTAAMVFLGDIVMDPGTYNGYTKTRRQPDIIAIGTTDQRPPAK